MFRKLLNGKMAWILTVILLLFMAAGVAEQERTDATGQWKYVPEDGGVMIIGWVGECDGDLLIPGELDGYPVTGIGNSAFYWCSGLISVTIPNGVTSIGAGAFCRCHSLTSMIIPDSVTSLGDFAFAWCDNLSSVTIPDGVTDMGANPFAGCPSSTLSVSPNNPVYAITDGVLLDTQKKALIYFPVDWEGAYTVPDGILHVGGRAFDGCAGLTGVTIPDSVTDIGGWAFSECGNLASATIPAGVTSIGDYAFDECYNLLLNVAKGSYAEQYAKENGIPYVLALPYKDLSANEIRSATVEILPKKVRGDLSDDAIEDLVAILRTIETNNRDDSHNSYGGQAVIFTITMMDGTEEIISAFNPFIIINGIGYRTDVCHELSGLGGTIAKTPY